MDLRLRGRRMLITGAASGIGAACAAALASEGASVGLIDVDADGLADVAAALAEGDRVPSGGPSTVRADVTNEADVRGAVDRLADSLGGVDGVICCAGVSGPFGRRPEAISAEEFTGVMAVNVLGPFLSVKCALPYLRRSQHRTVVLMGSDSAFVAAPGMAPYNASKGAVVQLTRALATDLADDAIRVNCVCPSVVDTPMARADLGKAAFGRAEFPVQTPEEVARHVAYLSSPVSRPVNGAAMMSDFGLSARSAFPA